MIYLVYIALISILEYALLVILYYYSNTDLTKATTLTYELNLMKYDLNATCFNKISYDLI